MSSTTTNNRTLYQDTPFETIPHVELGKAVRNAVLSRQIQETADRPESTGIGWIGDERSGQLVELYEDALEEIRQADEDGELEDQHTHAVVWTARETVWSEEEVAVHLLWAGDAERIRQSSTVALIERVRAYYEQDGRRERLADDDPLRELLKSIT